MFSSNAVREREALQSVQRLLPGIPSTRIFVKKFRDGFLPYEGSLDKETFEVLKGLGQLSATIDKSKIVVTAP